MKKSIRLVGIVFLVLLVIACATGCGDDDKKSSNDEKGNYKIYYPDKTGTKIVNDKISIMESDTEAIINELIIKLKEGNYKKAKEAVIPSDIEYATYTQEADILTLTFDENYNNLSGIEEVLKRASIVYTMLQIEHVDYVRIQVNGQALVIDDNEIGDMSKYSFMDLVGEGAGKKVNEKVKLYYADASGKKLRMLETDIKLDGSIKKEEVVLKKLISGPKGNENVGYYASINPDSHLKRVAINNKICYVDLNETFLERRGGVTEEAVVYSLVNTLTELGTVNQVRITINGELVEKYGESVRLDDLLEKNYDIISYEK